MKELQKLEMELKNDNARPVSPLQRQIITPGPLIQME